MFQHNLETNTSMLLTLLVFIKLKLKFFQDLLSLVPFIFTKPIGLDF